MADPYTTIDEVNAILPQDNQVDAETYPTYSEVASWLPALDSTINVAYALGGNILADATDDVKRWFGLLVKKEAAYSVMQAKGAARDNPSLWQGYHDDWIAALKQISSKDQAAAIAIITSTSGSPSGMTTQTPRFTVDKEY